MLQWSKIEANIVDENNVPEIPFSPQDEDIYLNKVYLGVIDTNNLDIEYHAKIGNWLYMGAELGFGGSADKFGIHTPLGKIIGGIRSNIYIFSAAKQYQQVRIMSKFIMDKGVKSTFKEFKDLASNVFDEFNKQYLKTEYSTAVGQSQMARDWGEYEVNKEQFPLIQYKTQKDGRVREAHAMLSDIIKPVGDKFWNYYMPKNGWNCRCFTIGLEEGKISKTKKYPPFGTNDFPSVFKMNPGKDKLVFKKNHPYFIVPKKDKDKKMNNFGMPIK